MAVIDPVLKKFRADLEALYGNRIERVVLYGSRARGGAQPDSDYDVAVFLRDVDDDDARWLEVDRIAVAAADILMATGAVINALPFRDGSYRERTPLMHEIRREGADL